MAFFFLFIVFCNLPLNCNKKKKSKKIILRERATFLVKKNLALLYGLRTPLLYSSRVICFLSSRRSHSYDKLLHYLLLGR